MSEKDKIIEYILSKEWIMTQGEFATKGAQRIEFDCEPYLISYHGNCYEFETLEELKKIITNGEKIIGDEIKTIIVKGGDNTTFRQVYRHIGEERFEIVGKEGDALLVKRI